MESKLCILVVVILAVVSQAEAAEAQEETAHHLAIAFLVLCCVAVFITLIIVFVLLRSKTKSGQSLSGSKYHMSSQQKSKRSYQSSEVYGVYQDPVVSGSIYLPLDKDRMDGGGHYAHLQSDKANGESHSYEMVTNGSSFKKTEVAYDNPGLARSKHDVSGSGSGSEHEYEMAEMAVKDNKPTVKNGNSSF